MAVASLIALAASASAVLMLRGARSMAVEQAANRLMLTARRARVTAIQTGTPQQLVLDEGNGQFFVTSEAAGKASSAFSDAPERMPMSDLTRLPEGVSFERIGVLGATEGMPSQVVFRPNGSAQTAVIQIGNGTHHATVTVLEATGRIQLQEGIVESITRDWVDLDEYEESTY